MNNKCEDFANLEDLLIDLGKLGKASVLPDFTEYETYLDLNERILYLDFDVNDALNVNPSNYSSTPMVAV